MKNKNLGAKRVKDNLIILLVAYYYFQFETYDVSKLIADMFLHLHFPPTDIPTM